MTITFYDDKTTKGFKIPGVYSLNGLGCDNHGRDAWIVFARQGTYTLRQDRFFIMEIDQ